MFPARKPSTTRARQGFTLVELLIVMVVIAVLAALIFPAIGGANKAVRITGVATEISQLDTAIAAFKNIHGIEPPSSIALFESHTDWDPANTTVPTTLVTAAQLVNSRAIIQQLWPQFDFTKDRDFNGTAGTQTGAAGTVILSPSECLVLFLGGTFKNSGTATSPLFSMIGFSKDPTDPFATVAGSPREAPLFEFQTNRLSDVNNNRIPEYKDNLPGQTMPYLYYSSYDGAGYNEASTWEFATGSKFVLATPYWQGADESTPRWKPNSHQIISPGFDGVYGYGGPFTGSGANAFPTATGTAPTGAQAAPTDGQRVNEADNITNFSKGAMQP